MNDEVTITLAETNEAHFTLACLLLANMCGREEVGIVTKHLGNLARDLYGWDELELADRLEAVGRVMIDYGGRFTFWLDGEHFNFEYRVKPKLN